MEKMKNGFTTQRNNKGFNVYKPDGTLFAKNVYEVEEYPVKGYWAVLNEKTYAPEKYLSGHRIIEPVGTLFFYDTKICVFNEIESYQRFGYIKTLEPVEMDFGEQKVLYNSKGECIAYNFDEIYQNGYVGVKKSPASSGTKIFDREKNLFLETEYLIKFSVKDFYAVHSSHSGWELFSPEKKSLAAGLEKIKFEEDGRIKISRSDGYNLKKVDYYDPDFNFIKSEII